MSNFNNSSHTSANGVSTATGQIKRAKKQQPPEQHATTNPPPQSVECEQSTIGAMLIDTSAADRAIEILEEHDFYREIHRKPFAATKHLRQLGTVADLVTVTEELRRRGQLEEVGGAAYLQALIEACPSSANVEAYANAVRATALRRAVLITSNTANEIVNSPDATDDDRRKAAAALVEALEDEARGRGKKTFTAIGLAGMLSRPRLEMLVQNFLLERGTGIISADYGAFKSFIAFHLALCVAMGMDWHGRKTKKGTVVFVMPEGAYTTKDRLRALMIRYGIETPPENFYIIEQPAQLSDEAVCTILINELRELNPSLVIFDTVAKCNVGRDENSTEAMSLFTHSMERMSRELNCFVLGIHHNNRNGQFRGNNSLPANVDAHITMEKSAGRVVTIKADRVKGAEFEPFSLIGRVVELGEYDEHGQEITSLVFEPVDRPVINEPQSKADQTRQHILSILKNDFSNGAMKGALQKKCDFVAKSTFYSHLKGMEEENLIFTDSYGKIRVSDLSGLSDSDSLDSESLSGLSERSLDLGQTGQTTVPESGKSVAAKSEFYGKKKPAATREAL